MPEDNGLSNEEPMPVHNDMPAVWDLVKNDIDDREEYGVAKYNTRLQPFNGRDVLKDAYQEALDLTVYLRQFIYEQDQNMSLFSFVARGIRERDVQAGVVLARNEEEARSIVAKNSRYGFSFYVHKLSFEGTMFEPVITL